MLLMVYQSKTNLLFVLLIIKKDSEIFILIIQGTLLEVQD